MNRDVLGREFCLECEKYADDIFKLVLRELEKVPAEKHSQYVVSLLMCSLHAALVEGRDDEDDSE